MSTQTARTPATARARHRRAPSGSSWRIPVALGVIYGGYAAFLDQNNGGSTTSTTVIAVVGAVAVAVVCYALGRARGSLAREPRSALLGTVFGCAMGFLLSLSGYSLLKASMAGLAFGLSMTAASFYLFYQHER